LAWNSPGHYEIPMAARPSPHCFYMAFRRPSLALWRLRFGAGAACSLRPNRKKECKMTDLLMLCLGLGFFAAAVAYVLACDRL
jgi:hypothetical protein